MTLHIGMCVGRTFPPTVAVELAERLDADGVDQLWVIEDCFYTTGVTLAAAALARTSALTVGIGILPAVHRTAAVTAMEFATLANLAPGRLLAGIGHGVQDWMAQMGVRPSSPLTALEEVITAVRDLLHGERVTVDGRYVVLDDVALAPPPTVAPPVLAGVRGPRSLEVAGRCADGLVLAEGGGPSYVRRAIGQAGDPDPFRVSVFSTLCVTDDARDAHRAMAPFVASLLPDPTPNILAHPHVDELVARWRDRGEDGIVDMPAAWWHEIGAIGTLDDAVAHVQALHEAGATDVALSPSAAVDVARGQVDDVARIATAVSAR